MDDLYIEFETMNKEKCMIQSNKTILDETYFFKEPISPNIAAKKEKKKIKKGVDKPNQICYISNIAYKEL